MIIRFIATVFRGEAKREFDPKAINYSPLIKECEAKIPLGKESSPEAVCVGLFRGRNYHRVYLDIGGFNNEGNVYFENMNKGGAEFVFCDPKKYKATEQAVIEATSILMDKLSAKYPNTRFVKNFGGRVRSEWFYSKEKARTWAKALSPSVFTRIFEPNKSVTKPNNLGGLKGVQVVVRLFAMLFFLTSGILWRNIGNGLSSLSFLGGEELGINDYQIIGWLSIIISFLLLVELFFFVNAGNASERELRKVEQIEKNMEQTERKVEWLTKLVTAQFLKNSTPQEEAKPPQEQ